MIVRECAITEKPRCSLSVYADGCVTVDLCQC